MQKVQKIGGFLKTDPDGFIINPTAEEKIQDAWRPVVDKVVQEYKRRFGDYLHSVYLRGSVPKGEAIEGVSDIDTIALVDQEPGDIDRSWTGDFRKDMKAAYPFVEDVELNIRSFSKLSETNKLMIKTQSLCVYGEDLSESIPSYRPGKQTVQHAQTIADEIEFVGNKLEEWGQDSEVVKIRCVWIMRRIVRTGCELVMERSGRYTRDLYPCYELFSQYYPEKEGEMYKALSFAVCPTTDTAATREVLDNLGEWLSEEVERVIWP